jgi:two-component system LytT family sensor kinase
MDARNFVALIHLVGFATGIALYGMLAVMTWRGARAEGGAGDTGRIPVLAAVLGLVWNAGALIVFGWQDFAHGELNPWLTTLSYVALGFLPAVVVDAATRRPGRGARPSGIAVAAYALSAAAAVIQATATLEGAPIPSGGLLTLTLGYAVILLALALTSRRRSGSQRAITAFALAAFAVSALHLSHHSNASDSSWFVELIGHHASLPLVLVILYQDYRFALADIFLKRALAVLVLVGVVLTAYALLAPLTAGVLLVAWIGTALAYPHLRDAIDRFVDRVMLGRADYREVRADLAADLAAAQSADEALERVCALIGEALTAGRVTWGQASGRNTDPAMPVTLDGGTEATVCVPTADEPQFIITVAGLSKGRRLLSDDVALLDGVALLVARRIDELRVTHERLERDVRESEMQRLTAEAELRALRAQLNPHFLFNALTTIGYLIRSSPSRALETLMQLTALLRAVLRGANGEFVTLGEEMQIVDAYLAIEQTRFEDRLHVERSVAVELECFSIPPLILQPLVENAIKHGVAPRRQGGTVRIEALLEDGPLLHLRVSDTGAGVSPQELTRRRSRGVGLSNIEQRLERYFGGRARLDISSTPGFGTVTDVRVPVTAA